MSSIPESEEVKEFDVKEELNRFHDRIHKDDEKYFKGFSSNPEWWMYSESVFDLEQQWYRYLMSIPSPQNNDEKNIILDMRNILVKHFNPEDKFIMKMKINEDDDTLSVNIFNPLSKINRSRKFINSTFLTLYYDSDKYDNRLIKLNNHDQMKGDPYEICLEMSLNMKSRYIYIGYLTRCGLKNAGRMFLDKVKDFAKKYDFKKIELEDASRIYIYIEDKEGNIITEIPISLSYFKVLKDGVSWYGKNGFTNEYYEKNKENIFKFIKTPINDLFKFFSEKIFKSYKDTYNTLSFSKYVDWSGIKTNMELFDFYYDNPDELLNTYYRNMVKDLSIFGINVLDNTDISSVMTLLEKYINMKCPENTCKESEIDKISKIKNIVRNFFYFMAYNLDLNPEYLRQWFYIL